LIYFDAAYVAKCYLNEPGAERVRALAHDTRGLCSCELARLEFACIVHRHLREASITPREARDVFEDFARDEEANVWRWLPVTSALIARVCDGVKKLPRRAVLRTGDAIHLGCARENGFREVYTNDRHMLEGARYFDLAGVNVIES
jgi:predicted nucleic acid-binding protein